METYTITKETMRNAQSYMPLGQKESLARQIADLCVKPTKTAEQNKIGETLLALPTLQEEDSALKNMLLLNTLLGYYLDVELKETAENGEAVDPYARYDFYAGGHIMNQLERFKGDAELKNKAFDLLADYKDFKKMVETEVYNKKVRENDAMGRLTASLAVFADPETVKALAEQLRTESERAADVIKEKKAIAETRAAEMRKGIAEK